MCVHHEGWDAVTENQDTSEIHGKTCQPFLARFSQSLQTVTSHRPQSPGTRRGGWGAGARGIPWAPERPSPPGRFRERKPGGRPPHPALTQKIYPDPLSEASIPTATKGKASGAKHGASGGETGEGAGKSELGGGDPLCHRKQARLPKFPIF